MTALFLKFLNLSITAGWLVLAVHAVRPFLKQSPRWIHCLLWGLVALRLGIPMKAESPFSLIPSPELIPGDIRPILTGDALRMPVDLPGKLGEHRMRFRLIPYQAVGVAGGMLLAVRLDWGEVAGKETSKISG